MRSMDEGQPKRRRGKRQSEPVAFIDELEWKTRKVRQTRTQVEGTRVLTSTVVRLGERDGRRWLILCRSKKEEVADGVTLAILRASNDNVLSGMELRQFTWMRDEHWGCPCGRRKLWDLAGADLEQTKRTPVLLLESLRKLGLNFNGTIRGG